MTILAACRFPLFPDAKNSLRVSPTGFTSQSIEYGDIHRMRLSSAPFPHEDRKNGYSYQGDFYPAPAHYGDSSVAVFVPKSFRSGDATDLVFFFHGWNSSIEEARLQFDLPRQFAESRVNALLVMPETAKDAPDSFGGKLEEENGFMRLVGELLTTLSGHGVIGAPRPGRIVLAGHSGSYEVISRILLLGGLAEHIGGVYLFDALYGGLSTFARWILEGGKRFISINVPGSPTSSNAELLSGRLDRSGIEARHGRDDPTLDPKYLNGSVVFLESPYDHYGVVCAADELRRFLATSPVLKKIESSPTH